MAFDQVGCLSVRERTNLFRRMIAKVQLLCLLAASFSWQAGAAVVLQFEIVGSISSTFCWKISTWLILPVVIRLSQRLSHACLSINNFVLWNCEWLIISVIVYSIVPYYLDNRSNSRANTCINTQLLVGRVAFIRLKPMQSSGWYCVES